MLPPYELRNKEFTRIMRGYNPAEVDEHISFMIEKYTELYRQNDELEKKLKEAYAKLDEVKTDEESIRSAMVNAQRASSKIMTEANDRADIILSTARKSCDRILADFKEKIQEERAVLIALNSAVSSFKNQLFDAYNKHISFIENIKLLDQNDLAEYVLTDESYTNKVISSIKEDIANMNLSDLQPLSERSEDGQFGEADPVSGQHPVRNNNVKDAIKEINRRITEDGQNDDGPSIPEERQRYSEKDITVEEFTKMLNELGAKDSDLKGGN